MPPTTPPPVAVDTRFVNGMRLSARHWLAVAALVTVALLAMPWLWKKVERFDTGPDYRIRYALSKDYWLYQRRLERTTPANITVIGDSVIWGEYVQPNGTLSHFLNEQSGQPGQFVNGGVNGLFGDGSVRFIANTITPVAWEGIGTRAGGEVVSLD